MNNEGLLERNLQVIIEKRRRKEAKQRHELIGRTPTRLPSIDSKLGGKKKVDPSSNKTGASLNLTKLDFEYIRQWNREERKKRLQSWQELLQSELQSNQSFLSRITTSLDAAAAKAERLKRREDQREAKILKRELETVTRYHIRLPQGTDENRRRGTGGSANIRSSIRSGGSRRSDDLRVKYNRADKKGRRKPSASQIRQEQVMSKIGKQLEQVQDKARAAQLRKTFGTGGWGAERHAQRDRELKRRTSLAPPRPAPPSAITDTVQDLRPKTEPLSLTTSPTTSASQSSTEQLRKRRHGPHGHHHHHHHHYYHHHHHRGSDLRTDLEEEEKTSSATHSPTGSKGSLTESELFQAMQWKPVVEKDKETKKRERKEKKKEKLLKKKAKNEGPADGAGGGVTGTPANSRGENDDSENKDDEDDLDEHGKYKRPEDPYEYQDTCFGSIRFVERNALRSVTKVNKGYEFYMTLGDTPLGLGMGKTDHFKVRFFKPEGAGIPHKKPKDRPSGNRTRELKWGDDERNKKQKITVNSFSEIQPAMLLDEKDNVKMLSELEQNLLEIPGISSGYRVEVQPSSRKPSITLPAVDRISRRTQFTRPPRRIWYTPLPLTIKKYYRTNWKKIRHDIRKRMKERNYWPKLWINFEETHPKQLHELIHAKMAVKQFDQFGFKRVFDWGRGVHPDYVDWILEDIVPHPGPYYYEGTTEPIRRGSFDEKDFKLKSWFVKPPRYIPDTPLSPPFDSYDFCGYGNRQKPFFLEFTLPREIMHYYAPPSEIETFFREIPKPPYAFPGYTFKRWLNYPLEQKLPQYYPFPRRFMSWTRGKIGAAIQCNGREFHLDDPLLLKRDLNYNVYHDPHTRKYVLRRDILDRIWELGIINSKGEVKCTMQEFNQNRVFLRDNEYQEECLRRWNMRWTDRQQSVHLTKDTNYDNMNWGEKNMKWREKYRRCKLYEKFREKLERKKSEQNKEKYERALEHAAKLREEIRVAMVARARERRRIQLKARRTVFTTAVHRTFLFQMIYKQRQSQAEKTRRVYYLNKIADKMEKQRETWNKRVEFHQQKVAEMKEMSLQIEDEYRSRVRKHRDRSIKLWDDVSFNVVRRRLNAERVMRIVRKYAMIWLEKVRRRLKRDPTPSHMSMWTKERHLDETIKFLRDKSGHVQAADFFFATFQFLKGPSLQRDDDNISDPSARPESRKPSTDRYQMQPFALTEESDTEESAISDDGETEVLVSMSGYEADGDDEMAF